MSKKSQKKFKGIILATGLGLCLVLFFLIQAPVKAAEGDKLPELSLNCFTEAECTAPPYRGTASKNEVSECTGDPQALLENRVHYCYAPKAIFCQPGSTNEEIKKEGCFTALEVSIGGQTIVGLEGYIAAIYKFLVAISGILAGLMITYAGVKWMLAAGSPDKITDAKKKVGDAIIGLILVVGSYVIMQTINPDLVALQMPRVKIARQLGVMAEGKCTMAGISQKDFDMVDKKTGQTYKSQLTCGGADFDCAKLPAACGGSSAGKCRPISCEAGKGGCYDVNPEKNISHLGLGREQKKYICSGPEICGDCGKVIINFVPCLSEGAGGVQMKCYDEGAEICMSSACQCRFYLLKTPGQPSKPMCMPALVEGKECMTDGECSSGICNEGLKEFKSTFKGRCAPDGGSLTPENCGKDKDCQSGICNTLTKKCAPLNGVTKGAVCGRNEECQSGLVCKGAKSGLRFCQ